MIPIPIAPDQVGAVGRLRRCLCPQPGGGLGEILRLGLKDLLKDGAMLRFRGSPGSGGSALQGLNEAIIEPANDKLAHGTLHIDIII
jgi:hypothetical protein